MRAALPCVSCQSVFSTARHGGSACLLRQTLGCRLWNPAAFSAELCQVVSEGVPDVLGVVIVDLYA